MARRGVDIGIINYQDTGNWGVFKPEGPTLHMQIYGRATTAIIQKYGDAVQLPHRETGFYDNFKPLDNEDIKEIKPTSKNCFKATSTIVVGAKLRLLVMFRDQSVILQYNLIYYPCYSNVACKP